MSLVDTRNIYCVGRNYRLHALELGNDVPTSPMIFTKPTHSRVAMNGGDIVIPKEKGEVHFELEIVLRISNQYTSGMKAEEAIDAFTLGLDLTLRDVQSRLKAKGYPWLPAKGFKQSATLGDWLPFVSLEQINCSEFTLIRNGEIAQLGHPSDMIFSIEQLIAFIDAEYGLGSGDLIYTGTPAGVAKLDEGDQLEVRWNGDLIGSCIIR
ncbi:MAG: fumarylacetoacetate hydrolase family protein [Candidatus Pristimantibacillus lignocellulolyticus]|uniref:Fumarylacetoacetate hydrolase family protein n=1 Tax=Candidatus Pristimantibacillus lignocellulolyticus TaxID=2994561 RepID=A0A9J6ZGA3_9BACL|nr:MAG: fumarylacetoacetate hydrolase family protein [Candidatus Pristimantibacillus lignocellulolyticus]